MSLVFFLNTYGAFLLFLGVSFYLWFFAQAKKEFFYVILTAGVALLVVYFLKFLFEAPRPYLLNGQMPKAGFFSSLHSFPSFHAAITFALATCVVRYQRRTGIILFLLASLIALGRVVAEVHRPLDVVGGATIGILLALFIGRLDT